MQTNKLNKVQITIAVLIIIALFVYGMFLDTAGKQMHLIAGVILGYTLTRSRFGFAGGIKRIYMRGEGSLSKALLLLFTVTTLVFFGIQWKAAIDGAVPSFDKEAIAAIEATGAKAKIIPGTDNVYLANLATIIGGLLFGFGMIVAGGCGSGTLSDFGEGEGRSLIAFIFFVISAAPGQWARTAFDTTALGKIGIRWHFPSTFGYVGALLITLAIYFLLYIVVIKYENRRKQEGTYMDPKGDYEEFEKPIPGTESGTFYNVYHKLFIERWSFEKGALILAIGAIFVMVTQNKAWGLTTSLVDLGLKIWHLLGGQTPELLEAKFGAQVSKSLLLHGGTIRNLGLFFGCAIAFLLAGRWRMNFKFNFKDGLWFAFGGLLLGFGSRFALGCNLGALYSSISNFSFSGWVFFLAMSAGAIIALKVLPGRVCTVGTLRKEQLKKLGKK